MTTLADVIAAIESNNNDHALRFEPLTFARFSTGTLTHKDLLQKIAKANGCDIQTACMIAATSWGKFQIMGMTLYSTLDCPESIIDFVSNDQPDMQDWAFRCFVAHYSIDYTPEQLASDRASREHFANVYNGPGNVPVYAERIAAELARRGFKVAAGPVGLGT